jgi:hypothetical protein
MPTILQHVASAVKGNSLYVAGGEYPIGASRNTVYIYDFLSGTWAAGNPVSSPDWRALDPAGFSPAPAGSPSCAAHRVRSAQVRPCRRRARMAAWHRSARTCTTLARPMQSRQTPTPSGIPPIPPIPRRLTNAREQRASIPTTAAPKPCAHSMLRHGVPTVTPSGWRCAPVLCSAGATTGRSHGVQLPRASHLRRCITCA